MHTLILTCAGLSTRFPGRKPKWALTHPSGNLMAAESIRGLTGYDRLVVAVREEHAFAYGTTNVQREFTLAGYPGAEVVLVGNTTSQVATVRDALVNADVTGSFTVKDCDNRFSLALAPDNSVAVVDLAYAGKVWASNKSYVLWSGLRITDVAEKRIISSLFSCGAYTFDAPALFTRFATDCTYVSEVVRNAVRGGAHFIPRPASQYVDWGTLEDWNAYCATYRTLFVDIDGVLATSAHRSFPPRWGEAPLIGPNVEFINQLHRTGRVEVILTTARPETFRAETERQLSCLRYDRLIMGLRHCPRYLVNDAPQPGDQTAVAINIDRDAPVLERMLRALGG